MTTTTRPAGTCRPVHALKGVVAAGGGGNGVWSWCGPVVKVLTGHGVKRWRVRIAVWLVKSSSPLLSLSHGNGWMNGRGGGGGPSV